jgi:hypothetical protein
MIFSTYFNPELSQRFTEDMVIRKLTAKTKIGYLKHPGLRFYFCQKLLKLY